MTPPLIALMTDFDEKDFFVPSVKAVILSMNPEARIVDVTHRIPPHDIRAASFILSACCPFFPERTIFLSVVDPGVGSARKILLAKTDKHSFIAPDNGLLTLPLAGARRLEVREITNAKYFLAAPGRTFEGRDRMAPAAAWLSLGAPAEEFGPTISRFKTFSVRPARRDGVKIRGEVAYIDTFGNLLTNIPASWLPQRCTQGRAGFRLMIKGRTVRSFKESYAQARPGELFALEGSLGTIEIALRERSAARMLRAAPGDEVTIAAA